MTSAERVVFIAYNVVWWVPVLLTVLGVLSYWTGSFGFVAMNVLRAVINAFRVNLMPVGVAQRFPLRIP